MILKVNISPKVYLPIIYILLGILIYELLCVIVKKILINNRISIIKNNLQKKRETTIINLIKNIIKYLIGIITILAILNVFEVKTTSIVASLGIVGAIIGLAFQDIIKNFLASITIIFDNHFMQGDYVTINGFFGEVVELGLQATKIKAYNGEVMVIGNSMINSVINHSMYNTKLIMNLPVPYDLSLEVINDTVSKVIEKVKDNKNVKDTSIKGIEVLNSNNFIYRVEIDCVSNTQYDINRTFMKLLKEEYDKLGVKVPGELMEIKNKK